MITPFGRALRKIRIDHGHILKDMADRLEVSSAFLSAVEVGKKSIPGDWIDQITQLYTLDQGQKEELLQEAERSVRKIKIDLGSMPSEKVDLALTFARRFEDMDEETTKRLMGILHRRDEEE